ncbi:recombinase family protein [Ferroacidibacillus organovorans]|uniref:Resolvase/invertase-type recombinase catalytic domain-containing protein n=1 Tax=Ferroacidibacillus organovorans TaxID=1765683 RepID=A0A853KB24_9BACL|nr:recombinase family protein [Ferroacidibacillus organovorans]KYP81759.1 hypothetical protein AYJ22_05860 [Ferroacidibacillus organovorans]OAG93309.1 hypothetical protein AYW79_11385 [Ferroacidibacillus organovorans]
MRMTVAYYRSSLEQQENSVPMQKDNAKLYAQKHGMTLQDHYDDEGKSARKKSEIERPAMHRLRQDIRSNLIGTIIVYKRDRLARRASEYMEFYRLCRKFDVKIIFTSGKEYPVFYSPFGEFIELIYAGIIEREAEVIVERLRETQITNFVNKKTVGNLPYGLVAIEGKQDKPEIHFQSDEVKEEIKGIYSDFLQWSTTRGEQKFSAFVQLQNERHPRRERLESEEEEIEYDEGGAKEPNARWTDTNLRGLLTNSLYMGKHRKTWEDQMYEVDRPECAIISPEAWEATNQAMKPFLAVQHETKKREFVLEGLIVCEFCKHPLVGRTSWRKQEPMDGYYCPTKTCPVRISATKCEEKIDEEVVGFLSILLKENGDALYREVMAEERRRIKAEMEKLQHQRTILQTRLKKDVSQYMQTRVSMPEIFQTKTNLDNLHHTMHRLEAELRSLHAFPLGTKRRNIRIQDLKIELKQGSAVRRRELLADLLLEVRVSKNTIEALVFRHPFQKVVSHVSS